MSIQYSGSTPINATFTQSTGTRAELADNVKTQLVAAGWASVTNAASDYTLTSATTPQSLVARVRVYDPGAGNCARLKFSDAGGVHTQAGDLFLLPAASKVWRVVANKYQFFVATPGTSAAREFACGGVPWVPSFLTVTNAVWCHGTSVSDTDVASYVLNTFRYALATDTFGGTGSTSGNQWAVWNSSVCEANGAGFAGGTVGAQRLMASSPGTQGALASGYRWADGTFQVYEPLIVWGATGSGAEAQIRGQLWDAVLVSDSFAAETQIAFDGHTYQAITHNNVGNAANYARGTLFHAVT